MKKTKIREYLETKRSEIVSIICELSSVPSVRSFATDSAPFGEDCLRALYKTSEIYERYGYKSKVSSDNKYLLADYGCGNKTIGIFAHADVVPAGEGWSVTEPFAPIEKDGVLIGRGVCDNKSGITSSLFAVEAIKNLGIPISSKIIMFTGSNEESGMEDIDSFVKHNDMPTVSLVPDAGFPVYYGEKGILRFKAISKRKLTYIKDIHGGQAFNIVLGKISLTLKNDSNLYNKLISDKRITVASNDSFLTIEVNGISKHAALPEGSVNALSVLTDILNEYGISLGDDGEELYSAVELVKDYYGSAFEGFPAQNDAFGKNTIVNGIVETIDGHLSMGFDVRFINEHSDELISIIKEKISQCGFDIEIVRNSPGFLTPRNDKYLNRLLKVYSECTGQDNPQPCINAGGTYSRCLKNSFSIGNYFGNPKPFDLPNGHGGVHQPDEYLNIDAHLDAIAITAEMMLALDEELSE